jgi:spore germination protein GerM
MFAKSKLPQVQLLNIVDNVAYVRIREALKLTQGMGTTGATAYIESVTYTLTSLPGIDYVDFDFHAGDHAMPGRYSR